MSWSVDIIARSISGQRSFLYLYRFFQKTRLFLLVKPCAITKRNKDLVYLQDLCIYHDEGAEKTRVHLIARGSGVVIYITYHIWLIHKIRNFTLSSFMMNANNLCLFSFTKDKKGKTLSCFFMSVTQRKNSWITYDPPLLAPPTPSQKLKVALNLQCKCFKFLQEDESRCSDYNSVTKNGDHGGYKTYWNPAALGLPFICLQESPTSVLHISAFTLQISF